jgi:drug/metabolite transporter superfamily protein YnfA
MSVRTSRKVISSVLGIKKNERGISGVTIAVVLAAFAVVTLTIVQAATSGDASAAQSGIPALIG